MLKFDLPFLQFHGNRRAVGIYKNLIFLRFKYLHLQIENQFRIDDPQLVVDVLPRVRIKLRNRYLRRAVHTLIRTGNVHGMTEWNALLQKLYRILLIVAKIEKIQIHIPMNHNFVVHCLFFLNLYPCLLP